MPLFAKYGLTVPELQDMLSANGGMCAICHEKPIEHIDHCHLTNKVREGLCSFCNKGLGHFQDNIKVMESAAEYLKKHNRQ